MSDILSFQTVLDHLLDSEKEIPHNHLQHYSDLDPESLGQFLDVWKHINPSRKLTLLDELLSNLDSDTLVSYEEIGRELLDDADGDVRARAIGLLAESDDPKLVDRMIGILLNDTDLAPRMEAANLLGEFVLLGELEELGETLLHKTEDALISVIRSEGNQSLQKRALESLGYSSREETISIIESAFERADPTWVASALRAMGRSHDNRWDEDVVGRLLDPDPRIRFAAVEAAGELSIEQAGPIVLQMLEDEEEEDDIVSAAIWSLSQIGGEDARVYLLNLLDQAEDEELVNYLEDALENLDFNEELDRFDLLSLDEDDSFDEWDDDEEE
jgi:HEAT repeat protein